jgi:hypothetical protein
MLSPPDKSEQADRATRKFGQTVDIIAIGGIFLPSPAPVNPAGLLDTGVGPGGGPGGQ